MNNSILSIYRYKKIGILLAGILYSSGVRADDFYIWAVENGSGVTFNFRGSVDLTGFPKITPFDQLGVKPWITPFLGEISFARQQGDFLSEHRVLPSSLGRTFGPGRKYFTATSRSGDYFGFSFEYSLLLPIGYRSHTVIAGMNTYSGETFASMGIDPAPFQFSSTFGNNTFHVFVEAPPLPADPSGPDLLIGTKWKDLLGNGIYESRSASSRQMISHQRRIFESNVATALLQLEVDGPIPAQVSLHSSGDRHPRMKVSARNVRFGGNVRAAIQSGRYSSLVAPDRPVRIYYRLKTDRFFAGVLRGGDRDDTIRFRLTSVGRFDHAAMNVRYR